MGRAARQLPGRKRIPPETMKILHLYSDWKWTGPAEPVLQMCRSLQDRGHHVVIAHARTPSAIDEDMTGKVREYGLTGTTEFALDRHLPPLRTMRDLWAIPRYVKREKFDVVHMHLCHDNCVGGYWIPLLAGGQCPVLVRTLHRRSVLKNSLGYRYMLTRLSHGLLVFTEGFRRQYIDRFGLDPDRVAVQPMPIDLERFSQSRSFRDMRPEFGIAPDAPLIGIVGRYQKYRKAEVFLEAAAKLLDVEPAARFMVIGRSSQIQETVVEPMHRLGIGKQVVLTGYRIDDYDDLIAGLDIFSLLMPGFDGTARAVREAMALGTPCVVSDFGMLPDIVPHETAGLVVSDDADALATAWLRLIRDPALRRSLGKGAADHAREHFRVDKVGECLESFYQKLGGGNNGRPFKR